jgi:ribonucleoside-diphosphate reductase alpha chain
MISRLLLDEDRALKRLATIPKDQRPIFDWRGLANGCDDLLEVGFEVEVDGQRRPFDMGEIADTLGNALADLETLRKHQDEIFTERNRDLVRTITLTVADQLANRVRETEQHDAAGAPMLRATDIYRIIERTLVRYNQHDLARSVLTRMQKHVPAQPGNPQPIMVPTKVIRRNGEAVPWNQHKIEAAVRKAFLSLELNSEPAVSIADAISRRMSDEARQFVHIEDLQDIVQEELMKQNHYKVAAAYITYRAHRTEERRIDEEHAKTGGDPQQQSFIMVSDELGNSEFWDGAELRKRMDYALLGLDVCLSRDEIEEELRRSLQPEMTRSDLKKTIILNARTLISHDADFAKFAGRILLTYIYEEVLGWSIVKDGIEALPLFHRRAFKRNLQRGVEIDRLDPRLLNYDLDRLGAALDPAADLDFDFLGISSLYDRYLIVDKKAKKARRIETPQLFWMRVAMGLFLREQNEGLDKVIALYNLYKSRRFCSSTPTLFNSGTLHSQLSSCYLYKVDDSIESIMIRGIAENAFLSKWAGGLGGSWTAVRGTGSYIKGTNGESQGVIPFLKLHNDQLVAVNQGGKRKGSGCAYLETWHNDVEDFLQLHDQTGDLRRRTFDMNTANWIPDLFMKRVESRQEWTLFRANETPDLHDLYGRAFESRYLEYEARAARGEITGKKVQALELWKSMLKMLFQTGHPWITFKDPCNVRSPQDHVGVIHSSNLCTEITLNTSADETAVCNLGSVVLETHLDERGNIDHAKLRETIRIAVRALDNVIDINYYPTEAARTANNRHRPIGLGVMGLQYALYRRGIAFASEEGVAFNDEIMEAVCFYAYEASSDLAAERGTYSSYEGSKWSRNLLPPDTVDLLQEERGMPIEVVRGGKLDWNPLRAKIARQGMRNSNVIAIAPTATISNIMGSCPCIEPLFKNLFGKENLGGAYLMLNPYLVKDLKRMGLWDSDMRESLILSKGELEPMDNVPDELKKRYATAFAIDPEFVLDAAARRQKWVDQSQSVNLWFPGTELTALSRIYRAAWRKGLKTTYYLRTLSASDIETSTVNKEKELRGVVAQSMAGLGSAAPSIPPVPGADAIAEAAAYWAAQKEKNMGGQPCEACT